MLTKAEVGDLVREVFHSIEGYDMTVMRGLRETIERQVKTISNFLTNTVPSPQNHSSIDRLSLLW